MTPLEELRSIGSFSGAMFKVLEDFDARLKAMEVHRSVLEEATRVFNDHAARLTECPNPSDVVADFQRRMRDQLPAEPPALPDAATPDSVGTGVEPLDVPGGITTSIKGISIK